MHGYIFVSVVVFIYIIFVMTWKKINRTITLIMSNYMVQIIINGAIMNLINIVVLFRPSSEIIYRYIGNL